MEMESPRSPEAEIGHRVEDLWEVAEPQLSPSEKLNSCFEDITVASFHRPLGSQGWLAYMVIYTPLPGTIYVLLCITGLCQ
ncbi:hypothetical protein DAI22_04g101300 [Oryza sativa Japonica Group]|nr:hypothetical protein DAI22_04g101300 [Oryza sativa Japonica Group]